MLFEYPDTRVARLVASLHIYWENMQLIAQWMCKDATERAACAIWVILRIKILRFLEVLVQIRNQQPK